MTRRVVPSVGAQERGERSWHIPVSINDMVVDAVVDTAAEITIISQRVYVAVWIVQPSWVGGEPGHIAPLLYDLRAHAPREIVGEAIAFVIFAISDLDLGEFTSLHHRIDTDEAKPVK